MKADEVFFLFCNVQLAFRVVQPVAFQMDQVAFEMYLRILRRKCTFWSVVTPPPTRVCDAPPYERMRSAFLFFLTAPLVAFQMYQVAFEMYLRMIGFET